MRYSEALKFMYSYIASTLGNRGINIKIRPGIMELGGKEMETIVAEGYGSMLTASEARRIANYSITVGEVMEIIDRNEAELKKYLKENE